MHFFPIRMPNMPRRHLAIDHIDVRVPSRVARRRAKAIEFDDDFDNHPAVFFEDPAGTPLELCARVRPAIGS